MIGVRVRDDGTGDRHPRVHVEIARGAVESLGAEFEQRHFSIMSPAAEPPGCADVIELRAETLLLT